MLDRRETIGTRMGVNGHARSPQLHVDKTTLRYTHGSERSRGNPPVIRVFRNSIAQQYASLSGQRQPFFHLLTNIVQQMVRSNGHCEDDLRDGRRSKLVGEHFVNGRPRWFSLFVPTCRPRRLEIQQSCPVEFAISTQP